MAQGSGSDGGERVVPRVIRGCAAEAGEGPAVPGPRSRRSWRRPRLVGLPDLDQRVRDRLADAVVDRAVQPDRPGMTAWHQVGPTWEGQRVAEERADRLSGSRSQPG